jgi:anaerobic ribonucleoside-triphosphate reductase
MGEIMDERLTYANCTVCNGTIVERSSIHYIAVNKDMIGPGSCNIAMESHRQIDGYHCNVCGIEYHKLPFVNIRNSHNELR